MLALYTETLETLLKNKGYGTGSQDQSLTEVLGLMDKFPDFVFNENIRLSMKEMFLEKYDIREIGAETEELFLHYWREKTNHLLVKYVPKMTMWLNNFNDLFKFTVQLTIQDSQTNSKSITEDNSLSKSENNTKSTTEDNSLSRSENNTKSTTDDNQTKHTYYLNPVNNTTTNLKVDDVDLDEVDNSKSEAENKTLMDSEDKSKSEAENKTLMGSEDKSKEETENKSRTITRDALQVVWGKTRADIMNRILEIQDVFNDCLEEYQTIFMGVL